MSYSDLADDEYKVGRLVKHSLADKGSLEKLRQNLYVLHDRNIVQYFHDGTGAAWTNTVAYPSLVKIDATKFQLTITTHGGPVQTWFHGSVRRASGSEHNTYLTIMRENDPVDAYEPNWTGWATTWKAVSVWKPYPYLPAGTHTFAVYWAIQNGTVQSDLQAASKPSFQVWEGY